MHVLEPSNNEGGNSQWSGLGGEIKKLQNKVNAIEKNVGQIMYSISDLTDIINKRLPAEAQK